MKYFHFAVVTAALANAFVTQSWQALGFLALAVAIFFLMDRRLVETQALKDKQDEMDKAITQGQLQINEAIEELNSKVETVTKEYAEVAKTVQGSALAQAFRPRMKGIV